MDLTIPYTFYPVALPGWIAGLGAGLAGLVGFLAATRVASMIITFFVHAFSVDAPAAQHAGAREMRLWTLHPKYLDPAGLVALWRETLLARAVLQGNTRGYRHHPQLTRFRSQRQPIGSLNRYLTGVYREALRRGYAFDRRKLGRVRSGSRIAETAGQLAFEWTHLLAKLHRRRPQQYLELVTVQSPMPHPLFRVVPGPVREWERGDAGGVGTPGPERGRAT